VVILWLHRIQHFNMACHCHSHFYKNILILRAQQEHAVYCGSTWNRIGIRLKTSWVFVLQCRIFFSYESWWDSSGKQFPQPYLVTPVISISSHVFVSWTIKFISYNYVTCTWRIQDIIYIFSHCWIIGINILIIVHEFRRIGSRFTHAVVDFNGNGRVDPLDFRSATDYDNCIV